MSLLLGGQVGLRPLEGEDVWSLYKWFNDQRVLENLGADHIFFSVSMDEEKKIVERDINAPDKKAFMIIKLEDNAPIGIINLASIDPRNASAQLKIIIGEVGEWDKGYGEDAIGILLKFAFDQMNLNRIWLRVAEYNARAIKCYESSGFKLEGKMREDHFHKGSWRDALLMSVLRSEWRC